ncbi:hypothetical protein HK102_009489, partial [Quaeritorhiza haematococci]
LRIKIVKNAVRGRYGRQGDGFASKNESSTRHEEGVSTEEVQVAGQRHEPAVVVTAEDSVPNQQNVPTENHHASGEEPQFEDEEVPMSPQSGSFVLPLPSPTPSSSISNHGANTQTQEFPSVVLNVYQPDSGSQSEEQQNPAVILPFNGTATTELDAPLPPLSNGHGARPGARAWQSRLSAGGPSRDSRSVYNRDTIVSTEIERLVPPPPPPKSPRASAKLSVNIASNDIGDNATEYSWSLPSEPGTLQGPTARHRDSQATITVTSPGAKRVSIPPPLPPKDDDEPVTTTPTPRTFIRIPTFHNSPIGSPSPSTFVSTSSSDSDLSSPPGVPLNTPLTPTAPVLPLAHDPDGYASKMEEPQDSLRTLGRTLTVGSGELPPRYSAITTDFTREERGERD